MLTIKHSPGTKTYNLVHQIDGLGIELILESSFFKEQILEKYKEHLRLYNNTGVIYLYDYIQPLKVKQLPPPANDEKLGE